MTDLEHVNVFVSGQDGYHTFRIPAVVRAVDGSLIAFAEARKYNRSDPGVNDNEIHLVQKRSTDGGGTWSAMTVIEAPGERWSAANAAAVLDRDTGRIWLHYLRCKPGRGSREARPGTDDLQNLTRYSDDHGQTWSHPIDITAACRDMNDAEWRCTVIGPGGGIQDRRGRLILAAWKQPYAVFAIFSEDHGRTWQRGQLVPGGVGSEDQLVELSDGRILLDFRQAGGSGPQRWTALSRDGGRSWSDPQPGQTVDCVSCAIERCPAAMSEDTPPRIVWTGPKGPGRSHLVARISSDDAATFPVERLITDERAAYSDLAELGNDGVGVLWERGNDVGNYAFITYTRLDRQFLSAER